MRETIPTRDEIKHRLARLNVREKNQGWTGSEHKSPVVDGSRSGSLVWSITRSRYLTEQEDWIGIVTFDEAGAATAHISASDASHAGPVVLLDGATLAMRLASGEAVSYLDLTTGLRVP